MKVVLHHIPKTAGTSLISCFQNYYKNKACNIARYDADLTDDLILSEDYCFYHGHYSFDAITRFLGLVNPKIITFLRHPIHRVISQYNNWTDVDKVLHEFSIQSERVQANPCLQEEDKLVILQSLESETKLIGSEISRMSLSDFLKSDIPQCKDVYFNYQVRYLSQEEEAYESMLQRTEKAIVNLTRYDFVGLTETYSASLKLLSRELDISSDFLDPQHVENTSNPRNRQNSKQLSSLEIDLLLESNFYDLQLYYYALGMHLENLRSLKFVADEDVQGCVASGIPKRI